TRELRTRLRSGEARMFILIATLLSAAAAIIPLLSSFGGSIQPSAAADLARSSFVSVAIVQLVIVWLIGPGVGSEVIAVEREKKTFEMLQASRLTARQILWGRVIGCWALLLLLASPAFPLLALGAFLHGVSPGGVLITIGWLVAFTYMISITSVCISALARSSVTGKWTAYSLGLFLGAIFTAVPITLAYSARNGDFLNDIAMIVGCAIVLVLLFIIVVAPLWYLAIARIRTDGTRSRRRWYHLPRPRLVFKRLNRRPVLQSLARMAGWALIGLLCATGVLRLAYHGTDIGGDTSTPVGKVDGALRLAFADGPAVRQFRSEIIHAYQNLDAERTAAQNEGLLVPLEKLQAPLPPDSQNAAPDYRRLMALLKSKPEGSYGEPEARQAGANVAGMGYPGSGYAQAPGHAQPPVGPLYRGKTKAGDGATIDMSTVVSDVGTEESSPAQEAAVREMLRQRTDIMGLIRQATDKPYCVFARDYSKGNSLPLPEYATMREAARLLRTESYLLAKKGHYQDAIAEQARGFRLAQHAASDPFIISYLVGVACEDISVAGMERILYLGGSNQEIAKMVREAVITNRPHYAFRRYMTGETSIHAATLEKARDDPSQIPALLQTMDGEGGPTSSNDASNSDGDNLFRGALYIPGVSALVKRTLAAVEAHVIHDGRTIAMDSTLTFPQQLAENSHRLFENDLIQAYASSFGTSDFVLKAEIRVRAQEAALIGGASILRYRAVHGRLPEKLSDAGPVPQDPFTGQPMGYVRDGDRFIIYSRGESRTFDGKLLLDLGKPSSKRGGDSSVILSPSQSAIHAALETYSRESYFAYPEIRG
ncbi:MAG TPA: hypothetical protein VFJ58_11485, partial [Armatimonadota bacterium]|nr:hypothetical protein [Armatimonadota bacterium]